jgi:hypothetical protein
MKNKVLILALLVVFVSVSFIGCGGDNPKKVKEVKVQQVGAEGYILTWEAVGKNVAGYQIVAKLEDKSSIFELYTLVTNQATFQSVLGGLIALPNTEADNWTALITMYDGPIFGTYSYYFGVRAYSTIEDYSNIRWTKDKYTLVGE